MPNAGLNTGSQNDPKTATEHFIRKSKVAGLTPSEAIRQLNFDASASSWKDAYQIAFEYFREQMNGGDNV